MSKITPLPSIFLESGFNSGASMWFSLDSNSTWGSSVVPSAPQPDSSSSPILPSTSSLYSNDDNDNSVSSTSIWQSSPLPMKKNTAKPKQSKSPTDPLTKKTPAEEFVKISPNQRWNTEPIGFPNAQQQSYLAEKKTSMSVPNKPISSVQSSFPVPADNSSTVEEDLTPQSLYKTELCRSFEETGSCRYGLKCQFAHGRSELRPVIRHPKYKTEVCKTFHTIGTCPYGKRCRFIHIEPGFSQPPQLTKPSPPVLTKQPAAEYVNVSQNNSGWSNNWFEPTPTSVNLFSVGTAGSNRAKPSMIETVPVMKTSNEIHQPRSRLVIFQQICS